MSILYTVSTLSVRAIFSLVLSFYCLWRVNSLPHEISDIPPCPRNRPHTTMLQKSSVGDRAPHIRACFAKRRKLFFWDRFCGVWMLVENGGFRNSTAYSQCCLKSRIPQAPYRFWSKSKKKSSLGFNWRMVLCAEILGFNPEHYIICCFDLCLVKEIKKSFSKPKDIQIQSCSTHTMQPCSTKGILPGIFWGTFVGVFFGSGDRSIRWKWDGTDCWLEFSSNNFGEFRKQFCIKFGLKNGQLWGLAIFRVDL